LADNGDLEHDLQALWNLREKPRATQHGVSDVRDELQYVKEDQLAR